MDADKSNFRPTASIETLKQRATIIAQIRQFFAQRGFFEVETPLLSQDTVIDLHLEPFSVNQFNTSGTTCSHGKGQRFLQTSPEFAMKRLLAAGAERIYQITKAFRQEESGKDHNAEFTLLEWYEVGADYAQGQKTLSEFCGAFFVGSPISLTTYETIFEKRLDLNPFHDSTDLIRTRVQQFSGETVECSKWSRDDLLNWLMATVVQPHLGSKGPTIVNDWPASQSALARIRQCDDGVEVAERFELYINGLELANGYHELLDPKELAARNRRINTERMALGKPSLPPDSRLLAAMNQGLPPSAGVALGVDRLVMALLNCKSIREVIAFPFDLA